MDTAEPLGRHEPCGGHGVPEKQDAAHAEQCRIPDVNERINFWRMSRSKLEKFAENRTFPNFFQWEGEDFSPEAHFPMRGHWHERFFRNDHPIVLELVGTV